MSSTEVNVTATEANKQTIRRLFQAMNEHRVGDLRDYIAADVIDHNKIIHGEADEPGAAFDGFAQQLAASVTSRWLPRPRQGHRDARRQRPSGPVRPAGLGLAVIKVLTS